MPLLDINGIDVNYESVGSGHPVVLLHGWGTSGRVWDAQRTEFAGEYRIITVDWRGCGGTSAVDTGNTISQIAEDLRDVIVKLGLDKPIVVGTSMGGTFAVELAIRWPELIGGVVTVDAPYHGGVVEDPDPVKGLVD